MYRNLERELLSSASLIKKVQESEVYANKLYAALCNIQWYTKHPDEPWTCSWRYAGGIVASMKEPDQIMAGERGYCDYYCNGDEGTVDPEIEADLKELGWSWQYWP